MDASACSCRAARLQCALLPPVRGTGFIVAEEQAGHHPAHCGLRAVYPHYTVGCSTTAVRVMEYAETQKKNHARLERGSHGLQQREERFRLSGKDRQLFPVEITGGF